MCLRTPYNRDALFATIRFDGVRGQNVLTSVFSIIYTTDDVLVTSHDVIMSDIVWKNSSL